MVKDEIIDLIKDRRARVGVIGLGYVGLPLATEFASKGLSVVGFEVDVKKVRSEEHTSELQSQSNLVCRLLLEKKNVDEANSTCAAGAQVAALIAERGFESLDGPLVRVATPDVPIPFSPSLEQSVLPSVERVREACRELLAY